MEERYVALTFERGVATIELARPEKLNAVNQLMADQLEVALQEIVATGARCAVLRGKGRAFCAGADIAGSDANDAQASEKWITRIAELLQAIERLPCPLVAYVDGYALGFGASLAMAADLVLATSDALFGFPEVHHGLVPGVTMALLADRVGVNAANEIIYFGERFDAERARDYGIVNTVVTANAGEAALADWMERLARGGPTALRLSKRLARQMRSLPPESRFAAGVDAVLVGRQTEDAIEGVAAFREKRRPNWVRAAAGEPAASASTQAPKRQASKSEGQNQ